MSEDRIFPFLSSLCIFLTVVAPILCSNSDTSAELCFTFRSEFCPGGNQSLTTGAVLVYYNHTGEKSDAKNAISNLLEKEPVVLEPFANNNTCAFLNLPWTDHYQYILIEQTEHGGGQCNCLNITVFLNRSEIHCLPLSSEADFCGGLASHPRRVLLDLNHRNTSLNNENIDVKLDACGFTEVTGYETQDSQLDISCRNGGENILSEINISFSVIFFNESMECDTIDSFDEGIEFSVRFSSNTYKWIPLAFIYINATVNDSLNGIDSWDNRGYEDVDLIPVSNINEPVYINISICNGTLSNLFQFRWIQTSFLELEDPHTTSNVSDKSDVTNGPNYEGKNGNFNEIQQTLEIDLWSLENITITYSVNGAAQSECIDPMLSLRNANYSTNCNDGEDFENTFGGEADSYVNTPGDFISSRLAITEWYNTTLCSEQSREGESIDSNESVSNVPRGSVHELVLMVTNGGNVDSLDIINLLISAINNDGSIEGDFDPDFIENITVVGCAVLQSSMNSEVSQEVVDFGITFLQILDNLLFDYFPVDQHVRFMRIALRKLEVDITNIDQQYIVTFEDLKSDRQNITVSLPRNLLTMFAEDSSSINVTSAQYRDFHSVFSQDLALRNESSLVSDIVSASLQCGSTSCNTSDLMLQSNVTITFNHSIPLKLNESLEVVCAFLNIQERTGNNSNSTLPYTGQWLTEGCSRDETLSTESQTVCSCNHLTHFALLLSPKPPVFSQPHRLYLSIIGYIGVGISVLAMTATVLIFSCLKSQYNIRNYIHINLCISLAIAQIIFVAGVDKTGQRNNPRGIVPVHCQVIAVLLHYFFLVSFMWMLMEGVFLYLALVKVFITNTKKYLFAFTVVSYGLPLLYLGLLTLPLGLALKEKHYGYTRACFLKHNSHFIWAFLAPVVIIFICNIALLVMAGIIMWKQQRKNYNIKESHKISTWLKAVISLMIVMGLTWIVGIFVLETERLLPLAYIYTIMAAFQGVSIFLVLVVFPKPVRDELFQWAIFTKYCNKKLFGAASIETNSTVLSNPIIEKDEPLDENGEQAQASTYK